MTTRVLAPAGGGSATLANGSRYVAGDGGTRDVPDADAVSLGAMGWTIVGTVGPTSSRPTAPATVTTTPPHLDTTLGSPQTPTHVYWDGKNWRDSNGART